MNLSPFDGFLSELTVLYVGSRALLSSASLGGSYSQCGEFHTGTEQRKQLQGFVAHPISIIQVPRGSILAASHESLAKNLSELITARGQHLRSLNWAYGLSC